MKNEEQLGQLETILRRIEQLLIAITKKMLKESLESALQDKHYRFLYEHTGNLPVKELARKTGLSAGTISRTWQRWEQAGLLIKDGKQYRKVLEL